MELFKSQKFWVIIYTLFLITSIIWGKKVSLSTSDWLALIAALIFGGVLMFNLFNFIIIDRERKLKHSEDLVKEVFRHTASNGSVYYEYDKISSISVKWVKSVDASQHLKHKKYKKLCHAYEYAKDYANGQISHIENELRHYRKTVTQMLIDAQIQLPVSEKYIDHKTEHYNISFIRYLIFDDIYRELRGRDRGNKLRIDGSAIYWGGTEFAVGEVSSLEYLKNAIYEIESDKTIKDIVRSIKAERLLLDNNIWLNQFNDEREKIVKYVIKKKRPLEGKCDMCPD